MNFALTFTDKVMQIKLTLNLDVEIDDSKMLEFEIMGSLKFC